MLRELAIKNFAIIDDLKIAFDEGLSIRSGETGAGKSIIINAVNLLLGSRAAAGLIRSGEETAELEALFAVSPQSSVAALMGDYDLDPAEGLLIRRIISRSDRHKIYINGRLGTIGMLTSLTENLASISGQHAHQGLLKEEQHLMILDQLGGLNGMRDAVHQSYHAILPLLRELQQLLTAGREQAERIQLLEFQHQEITDAGVAPDEDSLLEQERNRLKNSEALYQAVFTGIEELYHADGAIVERLVAVKKTLAKVSQVDRQLLAPAEKLAEMTYQLEDISQDLRQYLDAIPMDDRRLEEVEARLDRLNRLKRKYGGTLDAVFAKRDAIENELAEIENISKKIDATRQRLGELHDHLVQAATALSAKRRATAALLARKVVAELATLEMARTEFNVALDTIPAGGTSDPYLTAEGRAITETGFDRAVFLIAPNVGEPLKPLSSIVSGGELSRVVLALKAILAQTESVETIVFDEVDAGIGGSVAEVVGRKLAALARHHQIICITHLPQIAKFGHHHFGISKHVSRGRTRTLIKRLAYADRIQELARMLGGETITQATLNHARELLAPHTDA